MLPYTSFFFLPLGHISLQAETPLVLLQSQALEDCGHSGHHRRVGSRVSLALLSSFSVTSGGKRGRELEHVEGRVYNGGEGGVWRGMGLS